MSGPETSAVSRIGSFDETNAGILKGAAADSCVMVIFGAGGDLTRRDLLPSLFELHRKQLLPAIFAVIGFSRRRWGSLREDGRRPGYGPESSTAAALSDRDGAPVHFDATSLRDETVKVLEAVNVEPVEIDGGAVQGQYGLGHINGEPARGYREEDGVTVDSATATFAALKLTLDNWRWADVPFYLRTGKRLARKVTEVAIEFKPTPHLMFSVGDTHPRQRSVLVLWLQPDEGIGQFFVAKQPGPEIVMRTVMMNFLYGDAFGVKEPPRAYAWLLLDVIQGDQTLFARADWIDKAWQVVDPIVKRWAAPLPVNFPNYAAGTAGPVSAVELMRRDGRRWRDL